MVANVTDSFNSHEGKPLHVHTQGVLDGVLSRTPASAVARIATIFHDVGKLNPNFQDKLKGQKVTGYSNHAYLSAYAFIAYCYNNGKSFMNEVEQNPSAFIEIITIITKHHGNLPNFPSIFGGTETSNLLTFIRDNPPIPATAFIERWLENINDFDRVQLTERQLLETDIIKCAQQVQSPEYAFNFFCDTQFDFASLINADKIDASKYLEFKSTEEIPVADFCLPFTELLMAHLSALKPTSTLNEVRTAMRQEATQNIVPLLQEGKYLFSLTAPTGAGKTFMLLDLAKQIIETTGAKRILYTLPFLSITEQVEGIVTKDIFSSLEKQILRIDSKAVDTEYEKLQEELDAEPSDKKERTLDAHLMAQKTFDYPFIITTFVQFFETFTSNRNGNLLKLPNFENTIFLIDEIQALPPRLYGFFTVLLEAFCRKHNAYAILSTATMPNFEIPNTTHQEKQFEFKDFFKDYNPPTELLNFEHYFNESVFNRYTIERAEGKWKMEDLIAKLLTETSSVLVIVNTIKDSKDLYELLNVKEVACELLNTHFTPNDRKKKIDNCKHKLKNGEHIILISTQLIEAGVDISFPKLYRDIAPIPNIIQSAGRCNRNGENPMGYVTVFELVNDSNRARADLVYGNEPILLQHSRDKIIGAIQEKDLLEIQKSTFNTIQQNLVFGTTKQLTKENATDPKNDLVGLIHDLQFETLGKFNLIENILGAGQQERSYYIPIDDKDEANGEFEQMEVLFYEMCSISKKDDFKGWMQKKRQLQQQLKKMSGQIVQIKTKTTDAHPKGLLKVTYGIHKLSSKENGYTFERGLFLSNDITQIF